MSLSNAKFGTAVFGDTLFGDLFEDPISVSWQGICPAVSSWNQFAKPDSDFVIQPIEANAWTIQGSGSLPISQCRGT